MKKNKELWINPEVNQIGDAMDLIKGTISDPPKENGTPSDGLFTNSISG